MHFTYQPTSDFGKPLSARLGLYPRMHDWTWTCLREVGAILSPWFIRLQFRFKNHHPHYLNAMRHLRHPKVAIVSNHQSHLDTFAILAALPWSIRRKLIVLAAEDYFYTQAQRAIMATLFCQAVAFNRLEWTTIRWWYEHLKALPEGWILFYPTGSRKEKCIQPGLLKVLLKAGWTILPLRLDGMEAAWPVDQAYAKPFAKISVTWLPPLQTNTIEETLTELEKAWT